MCCGSHDAKGRDVKCHLHRMKTLSEGGREDCFSRAGLRLGRVLLLSERGPARSIRDALIQVAALISPRTRDAILAPLGPPGNLSLTRAGALGFGSSRDAVRFERANVRPDPCDYCRGMGPRTLMRRGGRKSARWLLEVLGTSSPAYFSMANEDSHLAFAGPWTSSTMAVCLQ